MTGLVYEPDFLAVEEERSLIAQVQDLPLEAAKYKAYTAKRRTASFGFEYDFDHLKMHPAPPMPIPLRPARRDPLGLAT